MKILTVTNMWPSAARPFWGVFIKSQVDSLVAAGIDSTLYEIEGWRSTAEYFRAMARIPRLAREIGADLVHAHYGYSGAAALGVDVPLVVSFCGDDLLARPDGGGGYTLKSRALVHLSRRAAHRADAVIVKSEEMRRVIPEVPDVQVIPNGVDISQRQTRRMRRAGSAGLATRSRKCCCSRPTRTSRARISRSPLAVERRLRERGVDVRLEYMFGEPHTKIIQAMSAADVLLLPSFHEGSPNAVKEAMAVGLPVVAAPCGDCPELLCAMCIPPRSRSATNTRSARRRRGCWRRIRAATGARSSNRHSRWRKSRSA